MSLILTVACGNSLFIGHDEVMIKDIHGDGNVRVYAGGQNHILGDTKMTEVFPGVLMAAGLLANNPRRIRLSIKAPRDKLILRSKKYRERYGASASS